MHVPHTLLSIMTNLRYHKLVTWFSKAFKLAPWELLFSVYILNIFEVGMVQPKSSSFHVS